MINCKRGIGFLLAVMVFLFGCTSQNSQNNEENDGMTMFTGIGMKVDGKNIDLYSVRANNTHSWTTNAQNLCDQVAVGMFDMEGTAQIEITLSNSPSNVVVRPLSRGINPVINGKKVTFSISEPSQYSVEYGNNLRETILIFANPAEEFTGTTVLEAGIYTGTYTVDAGETLYLKPGAVIRGSVRMTSNSKLVGRGIIDGSIYDDWVRNGYQVVLPIETYNADNIEINGITIFDPNGWNIQLRDTSNVTISNIKIVASRCNSDGISIQSSDNITIKDSFIRTWDDGVVIKNYGDRDSYAITVKNCRMWTDLAQSLEIGFETNKGKKDNPKIYDVTFEDIEIFHALHKAPISIHNGDNAEIYNVTYKNITIENYQAGNGDGWNYLIDIANLTGDASGGAREWTSVRERGNIHNILIDNVKISGKTPSTRFDSRQGGSIYDVTVRNIYRDSVKLNFSSNVGVNATVNFY